MMIDTLQPRRWMLQEAAVLPQLEEMEIQSRRGRREEERCKSCGGTPCVFTHPKNRHRKPTDHDVLVQTLICGLGPHPTPSDTSPEISPDTMPPEISPDTMPPDILPEAPAPPRGERREDGDRYTPAAPWEEMVVTMLPFPTLIPVDDNDLKSMALSVEVVAPEFAFLTGGNTAHTVDVSDMAPMAMALPQKEELPVKPRPLQEVHQRQDFSGGARVPKRKPKPEQVGNSKEIVYVPHLLFQFVKTMLFILTILGGVECIRNSHISCEVA